MKDLLPFLDQLVGRFKLNSDLLVMQQIGENEKPYQKG